MQERLAMQKDNDYINLNDIDIEETDLERVENEYSRFLDAFEGVKGEIESLAREENRHLLALNEELRHEIEERKVIELRLSDQLLFLEALLDAISNPISFFDKSGNYIGINRAFMEFSNCPRDAVLGKPRDGVLKIERNIPITGGFQKEYKCLVEEMIVYNGAGEKRDVIIYSSDYETSSGEPGGRVEVLVDVTEQKELAEKQSEQEQMLIQQSKMAAMGEMIGHIAHQWRQPLTALTAVIHNINQSYQDHQLDRAVIEEYVEQGTLLAEKMSDTIDDFRDFFKPNKRKVLFNVKETVNGTLELLQATLNNSHIAIDISGDERLTVYGFENEYSQVLLNIINNSRDALVDNKTPDARITITYGREGDNAVIRVRDNAGGIPEAIIDKIFGPYFSTKTDRSGTGIGLYMAQTIIEKNMEGKIRAYNEAGGAVFEIAVRCYKPTVSL